MNPKENDSVFDENSDDEYDALKDEWVPGDEPMNDRQRRENRELDDEDRRNRW